MKKIRLDIDNLDVQSFVTHAGVAGRGTVQGAEDYYELPATVSKPPQCYIESGNCLGTRFDLECDTSFCITAQCETRDCPILVDTAVQPC